LTDYLIRIINISINNLYNMYSICIQKVASIQNSWQAVSESALTQNIKKIMGLNSKEIFRLLQDKIIWLEIAPETMLKSSDLESEFGVSRTLIREALIQLRSEGWVFGDGSQFVVIPLSIARYREAKEIRSILEVEANILAMNRISDEELVHLEKVEAEHRNFSSDTTIRKIAEADFNFHRLIYKATYNKQLEQQLTRLLAQNNRFWLSIPRVVKPEEYHHDTIDIIESIKDKDEKRLREATLTHIKWAADLIVNYF